MVRFTLSKPQRMLYKLAIGIFAVAIVWMLYFAVRDITQSLNKGISLAYTNKAPTDNGSIATQNLGFGDTINQADGESVLSWNGHKLYLLGPAEVVIDSAAVNLHSGYAYLESAGDLTITLNGHALTLPKLAGLYDSTIAGFTVFDGQIDLANSEQAKINSTILFDGAKFTTASFDRGQLQTDKWNRILTLLAAHSQLPLALTDTIAPVVSEVTPADNTSTAETSITISGKTEPGVTIRINKQTTVADANGKFSQNIDLPTGTVNILLVATDSAGNETDLNFHYTRTSSAVAGSGCSQPVFADQLTCLINAYRAQHQLLKFSLNTALTAAAAEHSGAMAQSQQLSDSEANGSTPASRCNAHGTTCSGENVFMLTDISAQSVLDYLKSQPDADANLLGVHTEVGVAVSGSYGTIVYR